MQSKFLYHKTLELLEKHRKRTAKATPKIEKKKHILNMYKECLFYLQSNANGSFLQISINFVEKRFTFSHFEGSTIP